MSAPSILILDDGELDRVQSLVARLPLDWMRCAEPDAAVPLETPRDLLITSGPRAMRLPPLEGAGEPLWLCIYDQDFLPLRERLRDLGVHYLVSGDLAPRTFLVFLQQLLYRGEERRQVRRIPLQCELELEVGRERRKGVLLELSRESCVFAGDEALAPGRRIAVRLPAELAGEPPLELHGSVLRTARRTGPPAGHDEIGVLRFDSLVADAMARIHLVLTGHALGTQVTPLHAEPGAGRAEASWQVGQDEAELGWKPERGERRGGFRHHYARRVDAIRWLDGAGLHAALGRDLSLSGVRVSASLLPGVGAAVTLALYSRDREEPVLVDGSVVGSGTARPDSRLRTSPPLSAAASRGCSRRRRASRTWSGAAARCTWPSSAAGSRIRSRAFTAAPPRAGARLRLAARNLRPTLVGLLARR